MKSKSVFFYMIANSGQLKITAKAWKTQINFPCGFWLKKDVVQYESVRWIIYQSLN
jgi:hypothetical protein